MKLLRRLACLMSLHRLTFLGRGPREFLSTLSSSGSPSTTPTPQYLRVDATEGDDGWLLYVCRDCGHREMHHLSRYHFTTPVVMGRVFR